MSALLASSVEERGTELSVTLSGIINETLDLSALLAQCAGRNVVLELEAVRRINSAGVREWVHFMDKLTASATSVVLSRCSTAFVQQIAMIPSVKGRAQLRSFMMPLVCPECDAQSLVAVAPGAPVSSPRPCAACSGALEIDDVTDPYLLLSKMR